MFEQVTPVVQDFIITLLTGLLAVLSAFIIAAVKKGFNWLSAKIDKISDDKAKSALDAAQENLEKIITKRVTALQQTLVGEIKDSIANDDGKYTRDDLLALSGKALESVKAQLTDATKEVLSSAYSDLDGFIRDSIESKVFELKNTIKTSTAGLLVDSSNVAELDSTDA